MAEKRRRKAEPGDARAPARQTAEPAGPRLKRGVVIGAALLVAAAFGAVAMLAAGGDGDGEESAGTQPSPTQTQTQFQEGILDRTVVDRRAGIIVRRPSNWSDTTGNGLVTVRSPGRCVVLSLSAPADTGDQKRLLSDSLAVLANANKNVRARPAGQGEVGGIPTIARTVTFKDEKGRQVRVVVSVGHGKKYAYLTEVVLRDPSCQDDLQRAQVVLSSIDYSK
jgi:hypothetical protein